MEKCPFYHVVKKTISSNEIGQHQTSTMAVPWCSHKHSLLPEKLARNAIGVANIITCGGNLDKCQVPKALFEDFK